MKLGLGTVQFGLDYGISNKEGQTLEAEAAQIITIASECGVCVIDTAALYGCSEQVLGRVLPKPHKFNVVTKTIRIDRDKITSDDVDQIETGFMGSLKHLRCYDVYGLLVHNADDLLVDGGEMIMERLLDLKRRGLVQKIGASVYSIRQINALVNRFSIDLIQLPVNVFDQRLITSGSLNQLKSYGVEVHIRSAFLQGVLLMQPDEIPAYLLPVRQYVARFHAFASELGLTPQEAAFGFLEARDDIDVIVCGVNNQQQLLELIKAARPLPGIDFSHFAITDDAILNPSRWRIT